ncbi:ParB/RepB/Spo0J family partition protein [bacterium]|nr:ParB/RepB/Spo0J family partition protein [bacterium]
MSRKRGLGKGLAELIPAAGPLKDGEKILDLRIAQIDANPFQPRREFDQEELNELRASIRSQGLLQPVTVREGDNGRYQLVTGERRLRACRDLGHTSIQAIVRDFSDRQLQELSLVENLIRADLNEIEVAEALENLQNRYAYTTSQLAEVIGKSRPAVSNTLRLLELSDKVKQLVRDSRISAGHGRSILSFPGEQREEIAETCAREGWSVRELERRAAEAANRQPIRRPRKKLVVKPVEPTRLKQAESRLMEHLGTRVRLSEQAGNGSINISYHGDEDLERLLSILLSDTDPL